MRKLTEEHKKKLSEAAIRKFRRGFVHGMKGCKHTQETKERMSNAKIGKKRKPHSKETKKKISKSRKGMKFSKEHIYNLSISHKGITMSQEAKDKISAYMKIANRGKNNGMYGRRGSLSHRWKGGITQQHLLIRGSSEYREWRIAVFERDKYTCIWCGDDKGGNLEADHIHPFSLYPELRLTVENGRTLCHSCHMKTDTYGYKLLKRNDSILQAHEHSQL